MHCIHVLLIFEIIRIIRWFYVLNVTFSRPLISSIYFRKLVLKINEVLFSSVYCAVLLLFSKFLITVLFVSIISLVQCMSTVSLVASHQSFCHIIFIVFILYLYSYLYSQILWKCFCRLESSLSKVIDFNKLILFK